MKVYIATALARAADHNRVRDVLIAAGHEITYDWTVHGSVKNEGEKRIAEVAALELKGVCDADIVVVLLPGGRGTHVELGMAVALGKPVVAVAIPTTRAFESGVDTCAFYWAPTVTRVYISGWDDPGEIEHIANVVSSLSLPVRLTTDDAGRAERVADALTAYLTGSGFKWDDAMKLARAVLAAADGREPFAPQWTTTPPTEPGWYWVKKYMSDEPQPGRVHGKATDNHSGIWYPFDMRTSLVMPFWWPVRIPEPPR